MSKNIKSIISLILISITSGCISTEVSPSFKLQIVDIKEKPMPHTEIEQVWWDSSVGDTFHSEILFTDDEGFVSFPRRMVTKDILTRTMWLIWRGMLFWNPRISFGPFMYVEVKGKEWKGSFNYNKYERTIPEQLVIEKK